MTSNQLKWAEIQENKRSHQVNEEETNRSNLAREGETYRHNVASESTELGKLWESSRHNQETERETKRKNVYDQLITQRGQDMTYLAASNKLEMDRRMRNADRAESARKTDIEHRDRQTKMETDTILGIGNMALKGVTSIAGLAAGL